MKLREYFRHDFIIPALVFFVIQPAIFFFGIFVFAHGVYTSIFGG